MTNTAIVDILVKNGMALKDAAEAVADYTAEDLALDILVREYTYDHDTIKAMGADERRALRKKLQDMLDYCMYEDPNNLWDVVYASYLILSQIEDEEYREANMADFRAYEAKMYEPDFDWSFYSDWHKDMFGYRPHYRVIPSTEEEREALFTKFHAERGF